MDNQKTTGVFQLPDGNWGFRFKAKLNGKDLTRCWLDWDEIASGGTLELWLGTEPNTAWGLRDSQSPN